MDLVDIDKVLDDLEFDENEILTKRQQRLNTDSNSKYCGYESQTSQISDIIFEKSSDQTIGNRLDINSHLNNEKLGKHLSFGKEKLLWKSHNFGKNNLITSDAETSGYKNKIINGNIVSVRSGAVSQVFNSLDEYRRDVESLRVSLDANSINDGSSTKCQQPDIQTLEETHSNKIKIGQNLNMHSAEIIETKYKLFLEKSDIKFFNNNCAAKSVEDDESVEGLTSTSSITTSSPSSFSLGPSARSPTSVDCEADDDYIAINDYENELSNQSNSDSKRTKLLSKAEYHTKKLNLQNVIKKKNIEHLSNIEDEDDVQEESNGLNSIDLIGLSSISTSLNIENSLFSFQPELSIDHIKGSNFENLSYGKDEFHNEFVIECKGNCENEKISVIKSIEPIIKTESIENCVKYSENNCVEEPSGLIDYSGVSVCQSKNINEIKQKELTQLQHTFGSTMDEISDTELDSMLQDINNELQNNGSIQDGAFLTEDFFGSQKKNNSNKTDIKNTFDNLISMGSISLSNRSKKSSDEYNINYEMHNSLSNAKMSKKNIIKVEPESILEFENDNDIKLNIKQIDDDLNFPNADSLSQASTIEFADLQSQIDLRNIENENDVCSREIIKDYKIKIANSSIHVGNETKNFDDKSKEENEDFQLSITQSSEILKNKELNLSKPNNLIDESEEKNDTNISSGFLIKKTSETVEGNLCKLPGNVKCRVTDSTQDQKSEDETTNAIVIGDSIQTLDNSKEKTNTISATSLKIQKNQNYQLGKIPPFWIPDCEASVCMQCKIKFSLIKRRHHCRACGHVLCSLCCSQKAKLEFLGNDQEVRVCIKCHLIINNLEINIENTDNLPNESNAELGAVGGFNSNAYNNYAVPNYLSSMRNNSNNMCATRSPNPNNPMEYCSTIPPHEQVKKNQYNNKPISVMVPVGVLKREGALSKNRKDKNVIFSDGIRPGCDLADLDNNWLNKSGISNNSQNNSLKNSSYNKDYSQIVDPRILRKVLPNCDENNSYIPRESNSLPPIYEKLENTNEYVYKEVINDSTLIERLGKECLKFAIQRNLYVYVKIVKLTCCVNKTAINFTTYGMHNVGQDEIVILLQYENNNIIPKDIFVHLNEIYCDSDAGNPISDLGYSIPKQKHFLSVGPNSSTNGGFLYIRPTFQCLQELQLPDSPFLIGILIHLWEIPWAKIFPLRLMLRLGAQYRYYPSPHISIRGRKSVYAEIAQTIINFLADFRNYSYTIPIIRGMFIHMEDRKTNVLIPKNRQDQIIKALNNSSDHILALAGNFSKTADGHLVCIQNLESDCPDSHTYSTQAINIQGQPRRITGASFIVFNGALKTNSGLSGKCSIVEDGLMVHILSQKMQSIRKCLKNMQDVDIRCGSVNADESQTEIVSIQWVEDDIDFNTGIKSPIDEKKFDGISSIRIHSGLNYSNCNFIIRWNEIFLIKTKSESVHVNAKIDISIISEQIARSTATALVPLLDLLAASGCLKIGLRVTLFQDNVCYEAGSKNMKLAPLYMNALDNELIPVLHKQATLHEISNPIILELIFHILKK